MPKIKFKGLLLTVKDVQKSKKFYEDVLEQELLTEYGGWAEFANGISLAPKNEYIEYVNKEIAQMGGSPIISADRPNNFQVYFEVENLQHYVDKIKRADGITIIHDIVRAPHGQDTFRFYDFDNHIVEVSENLQDVFDRLVSEGKSLEDIAKLWEEDIENVKKHFVDGEYKNNWNSDL
ncbi:MAG: glyoxalase/bleomycin resistance/dioxygenase family protein [Defluviitaleaceae bacterium]|nr:glyoxalase/bleomycin resistance/dioxygenase family protein [Defluviitaleaceae bacterium]